MASSFPALAALAALAAGALGVLAGCHDVPPKCINVDLSCAPLYPPTFDNVWTNTLNVSCGSTKSSCHSNSNKAGGMTFADEATSYTELLSTAHIDPSRLRVDPGDAACSLLIVRTDSPGQWYQMPQGTPLSAPERCALVQWVQSGAPGPGSGLGSGI